MTDTPTIPLMSRLAKKWQDLPLATKGIVVIMLPLAVLLASLTSLYNREQELTDLEDQLKIALQNQRDIETVHTKLLQASTGVRDYLLTGDKLFLSIFESAKKQLPSILTALEQQLESQSQKERISAIAILVQQNLNSLNSLANYDADQASENLIVEFKLQVQNLNKLRNELEYLSAQEALLVTEDQKKVKLQRQRNLRVTLLAAFTGIFGSIIAVWIFSGTIVKRVKLLRDSAAHLARAESLDLPSKSNDELGQLSDELDHASTLLAKNIYDATEARREAEQANKEKSMFLSRTSHELRTPLNAILGFAQLLQDELAPGKQKDNVNMIRSAGEHLLKLINEVLDIARIESGEVILTLAPTPVNDLLEEAIHYISPLGKIRDIHIAYDIKGTLVALAERQKLLQVILNLLSNALKYGPVNSTVQLNAYQKDGLIIVEVFDEGAGIPKSLKQRLFTAFDRLGAEQSKIEGTGLGLALSKQLMTAMQGSIHVADDKSLFWIELKATTMQEQPNITLPAISAAKRAPSSAHKSKILYVEDNAGNRALVEAIIKRHLHLQLFCAATVREGKMMLSEIEPSLIIIDLHLPDDSGEVLVDYIKSSPKMANIPIIILSADAMPDTIKRLEAAGIDRYITKPIDIALFSQQVLTLTEKPIS
jgi:signal transduction histidine kinase/CheY-like chemotaxis protein